MKESDIRPDEAIREVNRLYQQDIQSLLAEADQFVVVPCPACESAARVHAFDKWGFQFDRCCDCDTVYVNPRPTHAQLIAYLQRAESQVYWAKHIFPATEAARRQSIFAPRAERVIDLCRRHGAPTDLLVDVGAGFGTFCLEMGERHVFRQVVAVEPDPSQVEQCRSRGVEVLGQPIEAVTLAGISVITNFELIEHLFSPREFLLACHRALADNGLFILTTPNLKGFDLLVLGEHSDNVEAPNHLNYFHTESLCRLLERTGFEVVETLTPGRLDAELVRKKVLNGLFSLDGQPFLQHVLIDQWDSLGAGFQQYLADAGLSSHLWVVAKKKPV